MQNDNELLRQYAENKSEAAFRAFVERHLSSVYSVALRRVGGDVHLAQDVTQRVFTDLARKSAILFRHRAINGWLFVSARYAAAEAVRRERRRHEREQAAMIFHQVQLEGPSESEWEHLRPGLDDLIAKLSEKDREAVLLRFFRNLSFVEIGERLSLSENTARMRVERAIEKIRSHLACQGVKSPAGALALVLASQSAVAVPASLSAVVTVSAVASSAAGNATLLWQFITMSKITVRVIAVVAAACIAILVAIAMTSKTSGIPGSTTAATLPVALQSTEPPNIAVVAVAPAPTAVKVEQPGLSAKAPVVPIGTVSLDFYEAGSSPADGFNAMTLIGARENTTLYVAEMPDLTLQDIAHAASLVGADGKPVLHIRFTPEGQKKFATLTRERSAGGKVSREAIVVDGTLISAPNFRQEINGPFADIVSEGPNWRAMFDAFLEALPPEKRN